MSSHFIGRGRTVVIQLEIPIKYKHNKVGTIRIATRSRFLQIGDSSQQEPIAPLLNPDNLSEITIRFNYFDSDDIILKH